MLFLFTEYGKKKGRRVIKKINKMKFIIFYPSESPNRNVRAPPPTHTHAPKLAQTQPYGVHDNFKMQYFFCKVTCALSFIACHIAYFKKSFEINVVHAFLFHIKWTFLFIYAGIFEKRTVLVTIISMNLLTSNNYY